MARVVLVATNGTVAPSFGKALDPNVELASQATLIATVKTDTAAVEAAVATLEADGATPTQAHVTALRGVWNTLKTDAAAPSLTAATGAVSSDAVLIINATNVTTRNALKAILDGFKLLCDGLSSFV